MENDLNNLEEKKYEIDGDKIYATLKTYECKSRDLCTWDAHLKYIDIHFIIEGSEYIGYANIDKLDFQEYVEEKDKVVLKGEGEYIRFEKDYFAIFFPQDAHMLIKAQNKLLLKKRKRQEYCPA
jgi:YhcH/YjgK/YiaL family protein